MASEKVIRILHSRGAPFSPEEMAAMSDAEGWKWIYSNRPPSSPRKNPNELEVCFTGFAPEEKDMMADLASTKGMTVKKSVTKNLKFLVTGEAPGPSKLEKAESQGVTILTEESFRKLVETGEIDES